jgi:ABC-type antimicrobial peptide transport system permease subunit
LPPQETVYRPITQYPRFSVYLAARARPGAAIDARDLGAAINTAVPGLPIADVATLDERLALSTRRERLMLALGGTLAAAALSLAAVGVYGAVSHSVAKRRREFGVRLALGATPASVRRRIVRGGVAVTSIGAAIGLAVAAAALQAIRATVVEGGSVDAGPFLFGLAAVVACAATAAWIPARRASRTDAVHTLRG